MITEEGNESILEEAQRLTHGARNKDYGHPLDDYTRTAALVSAMLVHKLKAPLTAHEMALVMVCVKLSREMNAPKRDNRTDGAGYFWVADQCLQEATRRAAPLKPLTFKDFPYAGEAPPGTMVEAVYRDGLQAAAEAPLKTLDLRSAGADAFANKLTGRTPKPVWLCQDGGCKRPLGHAGEHVDV